jgi:hypothetical protein
MESQGDKCECIAEVIEALDTSPGVCQALIGILSLGLNGHLVVH